MSSSSCGPEGGREGLRIPGGTCRRRARRASASSWASRPAPKLIPAERRGVDHDSPTSRLNIEAMGTEKCRWAVVKTTPANCPKSLGVYVGLQQCTPLTNVNSASPTHCLHTIPVWPLPTNPNDDEWYQSDAIEASSQYGRTHTHTQRGGGMRGRFHHKHRRRNLPLAGGVSQRRRSAHAR